MASIIKVDTIQTAAGGTPTAADLGLNISGNVLQVVSTTSSTQKGSTSGTYADSGLEVTITPQSTTSTIVIHAQHQVSVISGSGYGNLRLVRDGSNICLFGRNLTVTENSCFGSSVIFEDTPSTTSAVTYKTQFARVSSAGTFTLQQNSAVATMVVMEIAG